MSTGPAIMSIEALCEKLDVEFNAVIERLRREWAAQRPNDRVTFNGTVAGFMFKTGIGLAAIGGCPEADLRRAVEIAFDEAYGRKR